MFSKGSRASVLEVFEWSGRHSVTALQHCNEALMVAGSYRDFFRSGGWALVLRGCCLKTMTPNLAIELIFFGGVLTAASLVLLHAHPQIGQLTLFSGAAAGCLCLGLGILGLLRRGSRRMATIVLALVSTLGAIRTCSAWMEFLQEKSPPMEPLWFTVFFLFSVCLTKMFIREGK